MAIGKGFVAKKNKPKGTRVTRITEKSEDMHFKSFFEGWNKGPNFAIDK